VVFGVGPLLQQQSSLTVEDEYRKGAMQPASSVRLYFFHGTHVVSICIDEDNFVSV